MSTWFIAYDDVAQKYSTVGPEIYHDAWYIRGNEIAEGDPNDNDSIFWDAAEGKWVYRPGGSAYNGYFPMGW